MNPFFSFGVVTYDRKELLKECVGSILVQSFEDFEVIISNDYIEDKVELSELGIDDSRVRIINQAVNLGPWQNHNFTFEESCGKYFSWLSDDDLISPDYLETMYKSIISNNEPLRIFTAYESGELSSGFSVGNSTVYENVVLSGEEFLHKYLMREINTVGHYGVFKSSYLKELGGLDNLGQGIYSPYNDNLLAIRTGLLSKIIYVNLPLVFFRTHAESSSMSVSNIINFTSAQYDFLNKALLVINDSKLKLYKSENIYNILLWCLNDLFSVLVRSGQLLPVGIFRGLLFLESNSRKSGIYYIKFLKNILMQTIKYIKWYLLHGVFNSRK